VRPGWGASSRPAVSHRLRGALPSGDMNELPESTSSRSLGRMVVAVLILAVAAWVLLHLVIGIVTFLAVPVIAIAAIVAIVWAVRVLF
jgi:hypothetical protein